LTYTWIIFNKKSILLVGKILTLMFSDQFYVVTKILISKF